MRCEAIEHRWDGCRQDLPLPARKAFPGLPESAKQHLSAQPQTTQPHTHSLCLYPHRLTCAVWTWRYYGANCMLQLEAPRHQTRDSVTAWRVRSPTRRTHTERRAHLPSAALACRIRPPPRATIADHHRFAFSSSTTTRPCVGPIRFGSSASGTTPQRAPAPGKLFR